MFQEGMKMNPAIKQLWIDALRSGKYVQTDGQLRRKHGEANDTFCTYCALGVLCDIAADHGIGEWDDESFDCSRVNLTGCYDRSDQMLPYSVQKWAGITHANPSVHITNTSTPYWETIVHLNDGQNYSFEEIAEILETNEIVSRL